MKGTHKRPYRDTYWAELAHCVGKSMEIFFPPDNEQRKLTPGYYNQAKAICGGCPVSDECLEYGLKEPFGIWGGKTPRERHSILHTIDSLIARSIRFDMRTESKKEPIYIPEQSSGNQHAESIPIRARQSSKR